MSRSASGTEVAAVRMHATSAQSISSGRREVQRYAGQQFDPDIVEVFLSISEQIWKELRSEIEVQSSTRRFGPGRALRTNNEPPEAR